jgi:hypothetical protein
MCEGLRCDGVAGLDGPKKRFLIVRHQCECGPKGAVCDWETTRTTCVAFNTNYLPARGQVP